MFSFFNKKTKESQDFSFLKVDMHSHLLPGIDDGLTNIDDTLRFVEELSSLGYQKLICTPHILPGVHENSPQTILPVLATVQAAVASQNMPIKIEAAAEYMVGLEFQESVNRGDNLLSFGNKYILVEMSYAAPSQNIAQVIFDLKIKGYRPILAHPERYNYLHSKTLDEYEEFIARGSLLQVNLLSLTGFYGKPVKQIAEQLIKKNMVSFIGTDMHHDGHLHMTKELAKSGYLKKLVKDVVLLNEGLL
jgi:protein-tyrosine phosphatase